MCAQDVKAEVAQLKKQLLEQEQGVEQLNATLQKAMNKLKRYREVGRPLLGVSALMSHAGPHTAVLAHQKIQLVKKLDLEGVRRSVVESLGLGDDAGADAIRHALAHTLSAAATAHAQPGSAQDEEAAANAKAAAIAAAAAAASASAGLNSEEVEKLKQENKTLSEEIEGLRVRT